MRRKIVSSEWFESITFINVCGVRIHPLNPSLPVDANVIWESTGHSASQETRIWLGPIKRQRTSWCSLPLAVGWCRHFLAVEGGIFVHSFDASVFSLKIVCRSATTFVCIFRQSVVVCDVGANGQEVRNHRSAHRRFSLLFPVRVFPWNSLNVRSM